MKQVSKKQSYNYKIEIAYQGTCYLGWQQLGGEERSNTIQGILNALLSDICGEKVHLIGASRTDANVHALGQVANFHTSHKCTEDMLPAWNRGLPADIQILSLEQVSKDFHSRYAAVAKQYEYQIYCEGKPSPFKRNTCLEVNDSLNIDAMRKAAILLTGTHDFAGFASQMPDGRSTIKTISSIGMEKQGQLLTITYEGDGFLYHMIRILTGTLIEIGLHKREANSIREIFDSRDRRLAGPTIDGKGLCLKKVYY